MDKNVEKLLVLQKLDLDIDEIRQKLTHDAERLRTLTAEAQEKKASFEHTKIQISQSETERKDLEGTLQVEEQRLNKSKSRLKAIKTQYEFQALQREIDTTKRANEELEETILKKMEEMESLKKALEDVGASYEAREQARLAFEQEALSREAELRKSLELMEREAQSLLESVEPKVLARYRFIRQRRSGSALVAVLEGTCQGCFMTVPPQQVNEIMQKATYDVCPNCSRMIYVPEPEAS